MDVSIIIVNYNSNAFTARCIQSLQTHTRNLDYEIIVVDNASTKDCLPNLQEQFPTICFVALPENIGFGRANNAGLAIARGKFVFLLNPDTVLLDNAVATFLSFMNKPENNQVAVCGGSLLDAAGKPAMSYGNFPSLLGNFLSIGLYFFIRKYYEQKLDTGVAANGQVMREVDYVSGAALFARKAVLDQVGYFDKDFFLYFEETELCWRIGKMKYRIVYLPAVQITHFEGSVTKSHQRNALPSFSFYHFYRSKRLYYQKTKKYLPVYGYYLFDILREVNKSILHRKISEIPGKLRLMTKRV